jgi:uncharacterized protein (DUF362 family)
MTDAKETLTAIIREEKAVYPMEAPFHPDTAYPEYDFAPQQLSPRNDAYRLVRETLRELQLDAENFNTPAWNPFGEFIRPGHKVVIKPNLVQDRHYRGGDINCLITHGSITRAVMDYVFKALKGRGEIILGDAPVLSTRFDKAVTCARLDEVIRFYREKAQPELRVFDFRKVAGALDERFHVTGWVEQEGDPSGTVEFNLGNQSMLHPIGHLAHLYRLPHYRHGDTDPYHNESINRFVVPRSIVTADVIINLPKMKTHCKAGLTAALKNFVGIVAVRHCYTNYRRGSPAHNGDEYPSPSLIKTISDILERAIDGNGTPIIRPLLALLHRINERIRVTLGIDNIRDGAWHGNDTVWRAILDLVRIARYGTAEGKLADTPKRALFTLCDGIIAGEGEGPLEARAKQVGCIIASLNPVAVDAATATLMHYDWQKIPTILNAERLTHWPLIPGQLAKVTCRWNNSEHPLPELPELNICPPFEPAYGWIGHIELDATSS